MLFLFVLKLTKAFILITKLNLFISTSGFQCITINAKSDYVLEIKLGEISQDNRMLDCSSENYISQDFAYGNDEKKVQIKLILKFCYF